MPTIFSVIFGGVVLLFLLEHVFPAVVIGAGYLLYYLAIYTGIAFWEGARFTAPLLVRVLIWAVHRAADGGEFLFFLAAEWWCGAPPEDACEDDFDDYGEQVSTRDRRCIGEPA